MRTDIQGGLKRRQRSRLGASQASAAQVGAAFKKNYAQDYPELHIYSGHKGMLEKESPLDIITVGVSDHRHADIVVDAANAGVKGIFCEKPLATTVRAGLGRWAPTALTRSVSTVNQFCMALRLCT